MTLLELIKKEAHNAFWEASDSNRADRHDERFDESVRQQFEKYWQDNGADMRVAKELIPIVTEAVSETVQEVLGNVRQ